MLRIQKKLARCTAGCLVLAAVSGWAGCGSKNSGSSGGTLPPAMTVAFQTPPPASVNTGSAPISLSAVVTDDTSSRGIDWVLSCTITPPNCGTLVPLHSDSGASVTYTPPASIKAKTETVNVVAFAASDHSRNAPFSFQVVGVEAGVGGTYVFEALGNYGSPNAVSGVLVLDGAGTITGGEISCVSCITPGSPPPAIPAPISGGSYSLDATGTGTLTVTASIPGGSDITLGFGLTVLHGSKLLLTESDSFGLLSGTGTMDRQTSTAIPSASFAFVMSGQVSNDPSFAAAYPQPVAFGGVFAVDSTNTITGIADENLDGMITTNVPLSGSITPVDSLGAVTVTLNAAFPPPASPAGLISPPIQLAGYVVDDQHIKLIGIPPDPSTGLGFNIGGIAVSQGADAGTFKTSSAFSGPFVYGILGQSQTIADVNQPTAGPEAWASAAWAGAFTADGAGNLTSGNADQELGFGLPAVTDTLTGTYTVDPSGIGRILATTNFGSAGAGPSFVFYLTGTGGPALALETDQAPGGGVPAGGVGAGIAYPQTAATISYNGKYGLNLTANSFGTEVDASALITVDGSGGTLAGSGNIGSTATGTEAPGVVNGTFIPGTDGRFPGSLNLLDTANNPISMGQGAFYVADPTQGFFIENDGVQVSLGYFIATTPSP